MEITAGRLLAPYVGMSLYSWTAIIAVVLAGLSLGNWCGGYLSDRPSERQVIPTVIKNDRWAFKRHAALRRISGDAQSRLPTVIMSQS